MFTHVSLGNILGLAGFEHVAHRYEGASGDTELWMLARAVSTPHEPSIEREPISALQRELALVPLRAPLGLPARARRHAQTLRADPADFGRRVRRRVQTQLGRMGRALRSR